MGAAMPLKSTCVAKNWRLALPFESRCSVAVPRLENRPNSIPDAQSFIEMFSYSART